MSLLDYLDRPTDLKGAPTSPTSLTLSWSAEGLYWQPDAFSISACHVRSLSPAALPRDDGEDRCKHFEFAPEATSQPWTMELDGLRDFSEYEVEIEAGLAQFEASKRASAKARTC